MVKWDHMEIITIHIKVRIVSIQVMVEIVQVIHRIIIHHLTAEIISVVVVIGMQEKRIPSIDFFFSSPHFSPSLFI